MSAINSLQRAQIEGEQKVLQALNSATSSLNEEQKKRKEIILKKVIVVPSNDRNYQPVSFTVSEFCEFINKNTITKPPLTIGGGAARFILAGHPFNDIDLYQQLQFAFFSAIEDSLIAFLESKLPQGHNLSASDIKKLYILKGSSIKNGMGTPIGISHRVGEIDLNSGPPTFSGTDDFLVSVCDDQFFVISSLNEPIAEKLERLYRKIFTIHHYNVPTRLYKRLPFLLTAGYKIVDLERCIALSLKQLKEDFPTKQEDSSNRLVETYIASLKDHYPNSEIGRLCFFANCLFFLQQLDDKEEKRRLISMLAQAFLKLNPLVFTKWTQFLIQKPELLNHVLSLMHGFLLYLARKNHPAILAYVSTVEQNVPRSQLTLFDQHLVLNRPEEEVVSNFLSALEIFPKEMVEGLPKDLLLSQFVLSEKPSELASFFVEVFKKNEKPHSLAFFQELYQKIGHLIDQKKIQEHLLYLKCRSHLVQAKELKQKTLEGLFALCSHKLLTSSNFTEEELKSVITLLKTFLKEDQKAPLKLFYEVWVFLNPEKTPLQYRYKITDLLIQLQVAPLEEERSALLTQLFRELHELIKQNPKDQRIPIYIYLILQSPEKFKFLDGLWAYFILLNAAPLPPLTIGKYALELLKNGKPPQECAELILKLADTLLKEKTPASIHCGEELLLSLAHHYQSIPWEEIRLKILFHLGTLIIEEKDSNYSRFYEALQAFQDLPRIAQEKLALLAKRNQDSFFTFLHIACLIDLDKLKTFVRTHHLILSSEMDTESAIIVLFYQVKKNDKRSLFECLEKFLKFRPHKLRLVAPYLSSACFLIKLLPQHFEEKVVVQYLSQVVELILEVTKGLKQPHQASRLLSEAVLNLIQNKSLISLGAHLLKVSAEKSFLDPHHLAICKRELVQLHLKENSLGDIESIKEHLSILFQELDQKHDLIHDVIHVLKLLLKKSEVKLAVDTFMRLLQCKAIKDSWNPEMEEIFIQLLHTIKKEQILIDAILPFLAHFKKEHLFSMVETLLQANKLDLIFQMWEKVPVKTLSEQEKLTLFILFCSFKNPNHLLLAFQLFLEKQPFRYEYWKSFLEKASQLGNRKIFTHAGNALLDSLLDENSLLNEEQKYVLTSYVIEMGKNLAKYKENEPHFERIEQCISVLIEQLLRFKECDKLMPFLQNSLFSYIEFLSFCPSNDRLEKALAMLAKFTSLNPSPKLLLVSSHHIMEGFYKLGDDANVQDTPLFVALRNSIFKYALEASTYPSDEMVVLLDNLLKASEKKHLLTLVTRIFLSFLQSISLVEVFKGKKRTTLQFKVIKDPHHMIQRVFTQVTHQLVVHSEFTLLIKLDRLASHVLYKEQPLNRYVKKMSDFLKEQVQEGQSCEPTTVNGYRIIRKTSSLLPIYAKYHPDLYRLVIADLLAKHMETGELQLPLTKLIVKAYTLKLYSKAGHFNHVKLLPVQCRVKQFQERVAREKHVIFGVAKTLSEDHSKLLLNYLLLFSHYSEVHDEDVAIHLSNCSLFIFDGIIAQVLLEENWTGFEQFLEYFTLYTKQIHLKRVLLPSVKAHLLKLITSVSLLKFISEKFDEAIYTYEEEEKFIAELDETTILKDLNILPFQRFHLIRSGVKVFFSISPDKVKSLFSEKHESLLIDRAIALFKIWLKSPLFITHEGKLNVFNRELFNSFILDIKKAAQGVLSKAPLAQLFAYLDSELAKK